jgi:hypothetical protein
MTRLRDGRTLKEIAEILEHKSLISTDRYAHLCTEHKSQILNETMNKAMSYNSEGARLVFARKKYPSKGMGFLLVINELLFGIDG